MEKLNQDFRDNRAFDFITVVVFILFLAFFVKSFITIIDAFETEVYANTMAELTNL